VGPEWQAEFRRLPGSLQLDPCVCLYTDKPAQIVILTADDPEDAQWRGAAFEHFMRDDAAVDAVYDNL
jgi:hypothetical protein